MAQEIYHRSEWGNPNEQWGNVYLNPDLTNELYKRASEYENSLVTDQILKGVGTKPSIILTPTAYEDGVLNSVKPAQVIGEELVTNGSFDTDSGWTKGTGWSIDLVTKTAKRSGAVSNSYIGQSINLTAGKKYKFEFTVLSITGTGTVYTPSTAQTILNFTTIGNKVAYFTPSNTQSYILGWYGIGSAELEIDNVSIKEVIDADFDFTRGSSATRVNELGLVQDVQILSGELVQNGDFEQIGSELVTNGDFDTDSDWTKSSQSTISESKARILSTDGSYQFIAQTNLGFSNTQGKIVKITLDIVEYVSGTLKAQFTGGTSYSFPASVGTHTIYVLNNGSTGTLNLARVAGVTDITIDNVSVKEVGQNWTFGTGWSMGDGKAIRTGTVSTALSQSFSALQNKKFRLSFEVSDWTVGGIEGYFSGGGGSDKFFYNTSIGNGSFTFEVTTTTNRTNFSFYAFGFFDGSIDNVSIIEITDDTDLPRINYTNFDYENGEVVPYSGEGSLLLEPQSTNLITYSEDFNNWLQTNATIDSNVEVSPAGETNASRINFSTSNSFIRFVSASGDPNGRSFTNSIYLKSDSSNSVKIGLLGSGGGLDYIQETLALTNKWQRFDISQTFSGSGDNVRFRIISTEVGSIFAWGGQLEELSYPTSYIPTNGSTVTRLADVCKNSGSSDLINSTEGVLYAEISALADDGTSRRISITDGTSNNRINISYHLTSNYIQSFGFVNGVPQFVFTLQITPSTTSFNKIAIKFKENDAALWVNGVEIATDNSVNTWANNTLNSLSFANTPSSSAESFYGNVKCLAVFKEALSDEELQKLTTI